MRIRLFVTAIALGVTLGAVAGASGPEGHGPMHGPPPIERVLDRHADELGLDGEVVERIHAIGERAREEEAGLREEAEARRNELHELLRQDLPDVDAVMRQAEAIGRAETALHKARLRTLLEVRSLLTPEQRAKLESIFESKRPVLRDRFGEGPPPHE